jgi:hypothetical protein
MIAIAAVLSVKFIGPLIFLSNQVECGCAHLKIERPNLRMPELLNRKPENSFIGTRKLNDECRGKTSRASGTFLGLHP